MENLSVTEIINRLFGKVIPVGETNEDAKRFENVQNYYEALCHIVSTLKIASEYKNRPEYSMSKIGKECFDILKEFELTSEEDNNIMLSDLIEREEELKILKDIEKEHKEENGKLREQIKQLENRLALFEEGELFTAKQLKFIEKERNKYFVNKTKIESLYEKYNNELFNELEEMDLYDSEDNEDKELVKHELIILKEFKEELLENK